MLLKTRALFSNRLVRHAVYWMTLTSSANGWDRAHLMSRGLVACLRSGRRRVLSAMNAKTAQQYGPYVKLDPLAYVTSHKPRSRGGFSPERGA